MPLIIIEESYLQRFSHTLKNDAVDLAINNQRRAFSDAYNTEVLAESKIYIELSSKNPLSKLSSLETEDLKNNPCILVINQTGQQDTACLFLTSNKPLLPE